MLSGDPLAIDASAVTLRITESIRETVLATLRRRGVVVGISGGIDSAVVAALAAKALGSERVFGLLMPERDSSPSSVRLGRAVAEAFSIPYAVEDIAPALRGVGAYERQNEAIREVFPDYGDGWKCKVSLPSLLESERLNVFQLTVESPGGERRSSRMPASAFLKLVAATNYKQRIRKMTEYYHADRLHYAVAGTPNLLEYDQGFFVKQGDGAADFKPIAHLYKTQVYALAKFLGVPAEVQKELPTTDTYSLPQTQEEFYFALPYDKMDLCLYGVNHGIPADDLARALGLTTAQIERVTKDIHAKRRSAKYLHARPVLVEPRADDHGSRGEG